MPPPDAESEHDVTQTPITADGWTGYSETDLAWFAENYAGTEWMVHVVGPDDVHTHANPDLDDDDPANPPLTAQTAHKLADGANRIGRDNAEQRAGGDEFMPVLHATVFHRGVPFDSDALMAEPATREDANPIARVRDFLHVHVRTRGVTEPIAIIDESREPGGHRWTLTADDLGRALVSANQHRRRALGLDESRDGAWNLFADIADITAWLDESNPTGPHEDSMRVMKIGEEFGEAVAAYIGMVGQNPRKGVTHTQADLLAELADVAVTALCAMQHFTQNATVTRGMLAAKVSGIIARSNIQPRGTEAAKAAEARDDALAGGR